MTNLIDVYASTCSAVPTNTPLAESVDVVEFNVDVLDSLDVMNAIYHHPTFVF